MILILILKSLVFRWFDFRITSFKVILILKKV